MTVVVVVWLQYTLYPCPYYYSWKYRDFVKFAIFFRDWRVKASFQAFFFKWRVFRRVLVSFSSSWQVRASYLSNGQVMTSYDKLWRVFKYKLVPTCRQQNVHQYTRRKDVLVNSPNSPQLAPTRRQVQWNDEGKPHTIKTNEGKVCAMIGWRLAYNHDPWREGKPSR